MDLVEATLLVKKLLKRPVAYHRAFCEMAGKACAGVMLSQAWYWSNRTDDDEGWFYKTGKEWREETGLSRTEQETARKRLVGLDLMQETERGMPCKMHFRVNVEKVVGQLVENPQTVSRQIIRKLVGQKSANLRVDNPQTVLITESTQDNTSETTYTCAQKKPRLKDSFDDRNDKSPKFGIELIRVLPEDWLDDTERLMQERYPALIFTEVHGEWCEARERDGAIGKFNCRNPTLVQYSADINIFFRNWNRNHIRNGNGNNGNGKGFQNSTAGGSDGAGTSRPEGIDDSIWDRAKRA